MTQPVTYYAQNDAIDSLTEKYGPSLDRMTRLEKLLLLALIIQAISGKDIEFQVIYPYSVTSELTEAWDSLIEESSEKDLVALSMALTNQLYNGVYAEVSQPPKLSDRDDSFPF